MSARKQPPSPFGPLAKKIAADDRGGLTHRWEYGRELLKLRAGRQRLAKGVIAGLVKDAAANGLIVSEQELQRYMRFAEVYPTEAHRRHAMTLMRSWYALVAAGFPAVDVDELDVDPDDLEDIGETDPEAIQDPLFDIPGFKPVLKVNGRKVMLTEATVREAVEYRDMVHEMHENFGRTGAQIDATVDAMLEGADGDLDANAVEAWKRATGVEDDDEAEAEAEDVAT